MDVEVCQILWRRDNQQVRAVIHVDPKERRFCREEHFLVNTVAH